MRRFVPIVLVSIFSLCAGVLIGQGRKKPAGIDGVPPAWAQPIEVHEPVPGPPPFTSRKIHSLEPFAVHDGGRQHRFAEPPHERDIWVINYNGGQVRVFCAVR